MSDIARPMSDIASVHAELVALSAALSQRSERLSEQLSCVEAREAAVEAREAVVCQSERDASLLRTLLEKESARLLDSGRERLNAAADAQIERLEAACVQLQQQCDQLRAARHQPSAVAPGMKKPVAERLPLKPTASQPMTAAMEAHSVDDSNAPPAERQHRQQQSHQQPHQQLCRARELSAALLLELDVIGADADAAAAAARSSAQPAAAAALEVARQKALPGAADALLSDPSLCAAQCWRLLRLLWQGLEADGAGESSEQRPLPQWERRLRRHLARAAANDSEPLFGRAVASAFPTAPLAALLLLRLSVRAQHGVHGVAGAAGSGIRDACEAVGCLRRLASDPGSRAALLRFGTVDHLVPLVGSALLTLARPAAAALLGLCATAPDVASAPGLACPLELLATPAFFRAAAAALHSASAAEGDESLAACVSVLLQRLSTRRANRALFETAGLRRALHGLVHTLGSEVECGNDFVRVNLRSCLLHTERNAPVEPLTPDKGNADDEVFKVAFASPGVVVPSSPC